MKGGNGRCKKERVKAEVAIMMFNEHEKIVVRKGKQEAAQRRKLKKKKRIKN